MNKKIHVEMRDIIYINMAYEIAKRSNMRKRHGCVIVYKNEIVGYGFNIRDKYSYDPDEARHSYHAERNAIAMVLTRSDGRKILKYCQVYLVMIDQMNVMHSKSPCDLCHKLLVRYGICGIYTCK